MKKDNSLIGRFESITELHAYLQNAETAEQFKGRCASFDGDEEFTKSLNMEQADDWLLHGQPEIVVKIEQSLASMAAADGVKDATATTRTTVRSVAGNKLNMAAYMAGEARCMYRTVRVPIKRPVINVVYNSGATAQYSAAEIVDAAFKVLYALIRIEKTGIRTNLYAATISEKSGQFGGILLRVKDAEQPFNVLKTAYPLCHASMLRRHKFRYIETQKAAKSGWVYGYGRSVDIHGLKESLQGILQYDCCITFYDTRHMTVEDIVEYILHNGQE